MEREKGFQRSLQGRLGEIDAHPSSLGPPAHPVLSQAILATLPGWSVAERLVGTFRRECLDHIIVVNERHLRHVLRDFVCHYNEARPHQALDLEVPVADARASPASAGRVGSRPVLAGLTHEYERKAA